MAELTLTERVRAQLVKLHRARKFSQVAVAQRLNQFPSAVNHTLHRADRPLTLEFLEAVADTAPSVLVAELVAPPGSTLKQLNPDEAALLRALRLWPAHVTRALGAFVAFFADEESEAVQTRNLHAYWRQMDQKDRDWFYGVAVLMREGSLGPDLRAGLVDRLEDARRGGAARREDKRPKGTP